MVTEPETNFNNDTEVISTKDTPAGKAQVYVMGIESILERRLKHPYVIFSVAIKIPLSTVNLEICLLGEV